MEHYEKEQACGQELLSARLTEYGNSDYYPLHMPGHKRRALGQLPRELLCMDITEIDGFDNLHQPEGILLTLQKRAAKLYGAEETFYLINGSTCGILSAVSAALPRGGHLLIARNCHKSVYHACYLRSLTISYLYPELMEAYDICEAVTAKQVGEALDASPDIGAVLIVSPTYEGRIADIEGIARVVHQRGIPLIVDEAHGAHLGLGKGVAQNSCRLGADLVIHSVHKTLPAMTQTALLHVNGSLIDRDRLRRFLHIYQSSSPSYVLMASIDNALWQVETRGERLFRDFIHNWEEMCRHLSTCRHLQVLADLREPESRPEKTKLQDPGKLLVSVKKTGLSGQQLYDMLLQEYHLQLEMAAATYVLAMFTIGDTKEGFQRMTEALLQIDRRLDTDDRLEADSGFKAYGGPDTDLEPERKDRPIIPFSKAWDMDTVWCPITQCEGRYAGEFVNLYPPGTPLVVPGEPIGRKLIEQIRVYRKKGLSVQGVKQLGNELALQVLK